MIPTGLSGSWFYLILVTDVLVNFCGVTEPRPGLENLCGHDTGGIRVIVGEV
jgi:hypothetical protein